MAAHAYHSSPHVGGTLQCGSCIGNAKEENTRGDKPVRDSLETVMGERVGGETLSSSTFVPCESNSVAAASHRAYHQEYYFYC